MATILIVDDRPSNRQFLTTLLGYGGHRLLEAGDGAAALGLVRSDRPDLVITDILMPTMDGYEFVQHVRADPDVAPTPVIFYTATYSAPQAEKLAKTCGVCKVLSKPCEPEEILAAVNQALGVGDPVTVAPRVVKERAKAGTSQSADNTMSLYIKDLEDVKRGFEELASRGAKPGTKRDLVSELSKKFADNLASMQRVTTRLSALHEVAMEMMTERDPARLVQLFFAAACDLVDSKYAAIGMRDETEQAIQLAFAKRVDVAILRGEAGRTGLLATLLSGRPVLRMRSADGTPSADGLPDGHPPVRDLLGIPVAATNRVYGWMYFADGRGEKGFSDEDVRVVNAMARQLAVLYENAMLYDAIQRHAAKLQVESAERKRAQEALAEREAGLRRAQLMAKLAHVVTGPDGSFEAWSETLPQLVGLDAARMPQDTRGWLGIIHPEDRALFRNTSIEAGIKGVRTEVEYRIQRQDGGWSDVRQVMEPIGGQASSEGKMRWFNTLQDMTERKQAEENLRTSEERFRQMAENIHEVFFLTNADDSKIQYVSPAYEHIWGRSRESLFADPRSWGDSIHPDDRERISAERAKSAASGEFDYTYRIIRPDESVRWIWARGFPVFDKSGKPYRTAGIAEDITERKQAEEKIKGLNRVYAVLSGINGLIVRVRNRDELFREACWLAVEAGKFRMAWIGLVDREAMLVKPVAWHGTDAQYIHMMPLGLVDTEAQRCGLAGQAVRERTAITVDDMTQDARVLLKQEALERGFRSLVVLPLMIAEEPVGVLALYAGEVAFFDEEEMKLLLELAGDIAFALEHIEKAEKLDYLAYYDQLTGLANRTLFLERIGQKLIAASGSNSKVTVLSLDIERFREVNDAFGRQAGDELLKQVADRLRKAGGDESRLARIGGDDFAIVSAEAQSEEQLARLTELTLKGCFGSPFRIGDGEVTTSAKVGIAVFPNDGADAGTLLRNAEAALEKAKASGERYLFYTQEMTGRIAEKLSLESKLRQALEKEEFVLHYQPKVDLETRSIVGVEALIRWQSPERGLVPPLQFIPLLEETGLIQQVGSWALRRASLDHRSWAEQGLKAPRVAVNVSPIQMRQRNFVEVIEQAIVDGLAPTAIDLEITESLIMEDIQGSIQKLNAVRALSINVAIDDFGTGYSSLGYLAKLPVQSLKIDRSFINAMNKDPNAMTLVSTIISLAHSLRLKVIAEGVETEEQANFLRLLRCDEMQGYLFSKPLPAADLVAMLVKR